MRHLYAFLAGLVGLVAGLVVAHLVLVWGLQRADLFASRLTVLVVLLPAFVGYFTVEWGLARIDRQRRLMRLDAQHPTY